MFIYTCKAFVLTFAEVSAWKIIIELGLQYLASVYKISFSVLQFNWSQLGVLIIKTSKNNEKRFHRS